MTGIREAVILDRRFSEVKLPTLEGWQADPYDPSFHAPLQRNLAEAEEYDAEFPDHPAANAGWEHLASACGHIGKHDCERRAGYRL